MVASLEKLGYKEPSPVQTNIIPKALKGESLICQSETGSGKTHSYLIPIFEKVDPNLPRTQSIIICPSRELARQVFDFAKELCKFFPKHKVRLFTSDTQKSDNTDGLSVAPHIVIGTPGRLKDVLIDEYPLDLHNLRSLILDEADMLLDLGYFDSIDAIYGALNNDPQVMVFSATLNESLKEKLRRYISSEFLYESEVNMTAKGVKHHYVDIKHVGINEALMNFLKIKQPYLAIVFASKKETVNQVYAYLKQQKVSCIAFTGDLEQRERRKSIRLIKENRYQVVVASDLLSRGIDIEDVSDVISLDLPSDIDYYYHRAGRTGRFGKEGDSWIFYNSDTAEKAKQLLDSGIEFDFLTLKRDGLVSDPVGLLPKKKFSKKKAFGEEEAKEIKIVKANTRTNKVKPAYKKKRQWEIEKVKNKYKRKAIQKAIRKKKDEHYAQMAKLKGGE